MGKDTRDLDSLLNTIEERCNPPESAAVAFQIACLSLVTHRLPEVAQRSLSTARSFAAGDTTATKVREQIQECWHFVKQHAAEERGPEVSAVRAAICILTNQVEESRNDFVGSVGYFLDWVNAVENRVDEQEVLLREHFENCLPRATDKNALKR